MKKIFLVLSMLLISTVAQAQNTFLADAKIAVRSLISVNNTTAVIIKSGVAGANSPTPSTVYSVDGFNNGASLAYLKLYNQTPSTVVCGTTTPYARYLIPYGTSSSGGGFNISNINGDAYLNGITACITTGIADNDTGAPAANQFIVNIHYK